jgi:uncharacterized protein (DUF433 family)
MEGRKALLARIKSDPGIFSGRPILRDVRFRVIDVLEMMPEGMTREQILEEHPIPEADDSSACLRYATMTASNTAIVNAA